jgi:TATA-box binding protein (TBP) (component of TFIID and TFIIIB)
MSIDDEWANFINNDIVIENNKELELVNKDNTIDNKNYKNIPKCGDIYISTKTKIIYLNTNIDIYETFWNLPIINYDEQICGIIKKQIKISVTDKEELYKINKLISNEKYLIDKIINHIDNPDGRVKFKHIRKISIGISKKDLLKSKSDSKSAFYNCFVITLRINIDSMYKEYHLKIFNTGKLEIPGLKDDKSLDIILPSIIPLINKVTNKNISCIPKKIENVLINSNFNCKFYINRENLFNILRYKYKISASYDPCSYPGIQCIYYHNQNSNNDDNDDNDNDTNNDNLKQLNNTSNKYKISYMIFRTGSVLIVGKCDEIILYEAYNYIKKILHDEYHNIVIINDEINNTLAKKNLIKKSKVKKFTIIKNLDN